VPGDREGVDVVRRALLVADTVLFPRAQHVDQGMTRLTGGLAALAEAGLFGIAGPVGHGGSDLGRQELRRVTAAVASGCGATFFVWVQHHGVIGTLRSSPNSELVDALLAPMCAGELVAGVAFAHVRRPGPPAVRATRLDDGAWQLDGHAPWVTSWGIADWFCVAAESADGCLVWSMIPATDTTGVVATPLALAVLTATGTVALTFESCRIPSERVAVIEDVSTWRAVDRRRSSVGQTAALGVTARALRLLDERSDDADVAAAADRLRRELDATWSRDSELVASLDDDDIALASDHRAACLDLARRSTTALLAATGGRGMDLGHPAQRLAREADFYVIQAQTADGRAATLRSV
jgi:alkylation response protein AidB-like acyl-CoA dehydrogenase